MSDQLFDNQDNVVTNENKEYLPDLVGEGRRYKTPEDLAKSVAFKEDHIRKIEAENAKLREDLLAGKKLEDLLDKAVNRQVNTDTTRDPPPPPVNTTAPDITSEVRKVVEEISANQRASDNIAKVQDALRRQYGNDWQKVLRDKMADLGFDDVATTQMARTNPAGLVKIVAPAAVRNDVNPPRRDVNFDGRDTTSTVRNEAYYDALRKSNPKGFDTPAIQMQRRRDAVALGDAFFN